MSKIRYSQQISCARAFEAYYLFSYIFKSFLQFIICILFDIVEVRYTNCRILVSLFLKILKQQKIFSESESRGHVLQSQSDNSVDSGI